MKKNISDETKKEIAIVLEEARDAISYLTFDLVTLVCRPLWAVKNRNYGSWSLGKADIAERRILEIQSRIRSETSGRKRPRKRKS